MQTGRLFEIIYLLMDRKQVTTKELAEHFEVSTRTILRDLDALSVAGIPIYTERGHGGGVRLMEEYVLDKGVMTMDEKRLLLSGLQAVAAVRPNENEEILAKLQTMLGSASENWIEIDFGGWGNAKKEKDNFDIVKHAIWNRRQISFGYANSKGEISDRVAEPVKLVFRSASWYAYAYCMEKEDYRFFKLNRMQKLMQSESSFQRIKAAPAPAITYAREHVEKRHVTLWFDKSVAYRVYDEFTDYETDAEGNVLFDGELEYGDFLCQYLLSYGDKVRIIEPEELQAEYRGIVTRMLTQCEEHMI